MIIRHETFTVATEDRLQFMDLTKRVRDLLQRHEIKQGLVILNSLHTTTALFINEWQEALLHDIQALMDRLVGQADAIAITIRPTPIAIGATPLRTFALSCLADSFRCRWWTER